MFNGGTATVNAEPKLIFAAAIKANASPIILVHNYPSGKLLPIDSDVSLTSRMIEAGTCLGIPVIDHLIITNDGYHSIINNDDGYRNGIP